MATQAEEIEASKLKKGDEIHDPGTGITVRIKKIEALEGERLKLSYDHPHVLGFTVPADRIMTVRRRRRKKGKGKECKPNST